MTKTVKLIGVFLLTILGQTALSQTTFNYKENFQSILDKTKDINNNLSYDKLLKRFSINDTTLNDLEVLSLLIGFTDKPDYKPYEDLDTERKIYELNGLKKYNDALKLGLAFLEKHPFSVKTLFEIAYSFHKLGDEVKAQNYVYKGQKIFKAMYFSGDGKSKETATFALGPSDGQDYIHKFVGADIGTMGLEKTRMAIS